MRPARGLPVRRARRPWPCTAHRPSTAAEANTVTGGSGEPCMAGAVQSGSRFIAGVVQSPASRVWPELCRAGGQRIAGIEPGRAEPSRAGTGRECGGEAAGRRQESPWLQSGQAERAAQSPWAAAANQPATHGYLLAAAPPPTGGHHRPSSPPPPRGHLSPGQPEGGGGCRSPPVARTFRPRGRDGRTQLTSASPDTTRPPPPRLPDSARPV